MAATRTAGNIEIVFRDWLDAMRRGDIELMATRLAPDLVYQGVQPDWVCRGRDEVLARFRSRAGRLPPVEHLELVAAGDSVVLSVRGPGVGPPIEGTEDGAAGQATVVFTLRDGVITEMRDYRHRSEALRAVGASAEWR
jgi:ketosteroid isomerase-like protein